MEIKKFENSLIAFDFESEMVNATDMARIYKKRPVDFLKLDSTIAFIDALKSDVSQNNIDEDQIVITIKGGKHDNKSQGTWMCRKLSYKFAAWLDPHFEVFVYSVFDEIVKNYIIETKKRIENQQRQLDYFWDKSDQQDLYK